MLEMLNFGGIHPPSGLDPTIPPRPRRRNRFRPLPGAVMARCFGASSSVAGRARGPRVVGSTVTMVVSVPVVLVVSVLVNGRRVGPDRRGEEAHDPYHRSTRPLDVGERFVEEAGEHRRFADAGAATRDVVDTGQEPVPARKRSEGVPRGRSHARRHGYLRSARQTEKSMVASSGSARNQTLRSRPNRS